MPFEKPSDRGPQRPLIESLQNTLQELEIQHAKAGCRFHELRQTARPARLAETVRQSSFRPGDLKQTPLTFDPARTYVLLVFFLQRSGVRQEFNLDRAKKKFAPAAFRKNRAHVPIAMSGAEQFERGMMGKDGIGPRSCGNEVSIGLETVPTSAARNSRIKSSLESNDSTPAEVVFESVKGLRCRNPRLASEITEGEYGVFLELVFRIRRIKLTICAHVGNILPPINTKRQIKIEHTVRSRTD